ncbi:MAG TPA: hypothetical protein GXX39_02810 [Syntrophothermus lipocalidus]|uniref:Uncharacterized protein n=1 Tax=Syntrophothermus lipocalidus (strain DSM 12680 / TGB-C1) TaxID=643648 RepID=D7CJR6_SYNLT|nr:MULTISPECIES: hypothetical protein [Syntrophothermus]ADI03021.1 hypothetical protein Slip_2280 [Syntrophothermus lipocalidus DSM 12680]NSW82059.1 hypothetical protein [Syntrophothermus sp.]HHV76287.1 hypothetical protein [Syntrophothermus lipocalidus]
MQKQFAFITLLYLLAKIALFVLIWIATIRIQKKAMEAKKRREALRQRQQESANTEKEYIKPEDHPFL